MKKKSRHDKQQQQQQCGAGDDDGSGPARGGDCVDTETLASLQPTDTHRLPAPVRHSTRRLLVLLLLGGSVAEWLVCWTQVQKARVQIAVVTLSGDSLRQTVYTHCASVHQAEKLVATLLRVAGVTAGLAESNGSLLSGL